MRETIGLQVFRFSAMFPSSVRNGMLVSFRIKYSEKTRRKEIQNCNLRHFRVRKASFDHTLLDVLFHPLREPGCNFATEDNGKVRGLNAAPGNTQDMEATLANILLKECLGGSEHQIDQCLVKSSLA